ncbi:hypothetical protein DL96DRAFT_1628570 [Flagelloscypha sp. PMI_526]|nr:hypothetical protein DL96DRAFT_1628570 [Flagelloscypha sp. PMI_526]
MLPFDQLPLDLGRLIVISAALDDKSLKTSRTLSLVCHQVQHWIDPFLFRHLTFKRFRSILTYLALHDACNRPTSRAHRIRPFVWSIALFQPQPLQLAQCRQLLTVHNAVRSIFTEVPLPAGALHCICLPQLSRLFLPMPIGGNPTLAIHSLSEDYQPKLTHLDLSMWDIECIETIAPTLSRLTSLKALALGGEYISYETAIAILPLLPRSLEQILFYVDYFDSSKESSWMPSPERDAFCDGTLDPRIVVLYGFNEAQEGDSPLPPWIIQAPMFDDPEKLWSWTVPENETFWAKASNVLKKRDELKRRI